MNSNWKPLCLFLVVATMLHLTPPTFTQQDFSVAQVPNPFRVDDMYPPRSEIDVCRPIQDYIDRSSARYDSQLVTNTNADIIFDTDDSRIMSSRLQSRLNTLAASYKREFGRKMTVLKAWTPFPDPDLAGDDLSLHYEGRTVQIRLSRSNDYDDFLLLAVEAAFDWVFYADPNFIRLSVIPTTCERNIDCVFILDQSGSVGEDNHDIAKLFIQNVVSFFSIGASQTRVGFVSYSTRSRIEFDMNEYTTLSRLQTAIDRIGYRGGWTATELALNSTSLLLDPANGYGARPSAEGIPKIAILITDGKSNQYPLTVAAPNLKNSGVQVYTIGVGNYDLDELLFISSDPDNEHVFVLNNYRDALGFVDVLSVTTCESQAIVRPCESTASDVPEDILQYYQAECSSFLSSVLVELIDTQGTSFLYCSTTAANPGPLTQDTISDESTGVARRQCVLNLSQGTSSVFIGVQGQEADNSFSLVVMDNMFDVSEVYETVVEGDTGRVHNITQHLLPAVIGRSFEYEIVEGNEENQFTVTASGNLRIRSSAVINFDITPEYNLLILANQPTSDCNCAHIRIRIGVIRNRIDFETPNLPDVEVPEDADLGHDVVTITATGGAGEIAYSILSGNIGDAFEIDLSSGLIEVSSLLDFETRMDYTLTIQAVSVGTSVSGTIVQTVIVTDVNESPFFVTPCTMNLENEGCSFFIDENEPDGAIVGNIVADDLDLVSLPNGMLTYRFQSPTPHFEVDSSGRITTLQVLDREEADSHSLVLVVSDGCLGCSISISTPLLIIVNDLNDNAPVILGPAMVEVAENSVADSVVAQYQATDEDSVLHSNIEFYLSPSSVPFEIDLNEGILAVSGDIDYETVQEYNVTVTALNPGSTQSSSITVQIVVLNLNDESPVFSDTYSESMAEHSSVNSSVLTVVATDADLGSFGVVRYSILEGGNFGNSFKIDSETGEIRIAEDIDRETITMFQLMVEASDLGTPQPRRTTAEVSITITDINDNPPTFNPDMYSATLREDVSNNTNIFTVFAFDNDEPGTPNSDIVYSITLGNTGSVFSIDQDSGAVVVEGTLDFESEPSYQLTILAADKGSPELRDTAMATITVLNVNELPPTLSGNQTINITESEPVGSSVADFDAEDPDRMNVTFEIGAGNEENKFSIEESSGTIRLIKPLDFEMTLQYTLKIVVSDGMQSTSAFLTVYVLDVNEFTPMFQGSTSFEIEEEEPSGTLVGTVLAIDSDGSSPNSFVTYSFARQSQITQYFNLDPDSGAITTNGVLDREQLTQVFPPPASSQIVDIVARDQGSPSKQSFVTITIKLADINDNAPMFTQDSYESSLQENVDPNLSVFQVAATDADLGTNAEIRFLFELNDNVGSSVPFRVDEIGGLIDTIESLDCEQQPSYSFTLYAVDLGTPSLNSSSPGVLSIIDENDNSPIFTMDSYIVPVSESVRMGVVVYEVEATDRDKGKNGEVAYSVINSEMMQDSGENEVDEIPFLEIDPSSGELRLVTSFNFERDQTVNVTVVAKDMGIPRRTGTAAVVFVIENVDESPPAFPDLCNVGIPEDTSLNEIIIQCAAVDSDNTAPSDDVVLVTYGILTGNDENKFEININTSEIILVGTLDREAESFYRLGIQARDLSGKTAHQFIEITVNDVNDNPPEFSANSYSFDFTVARIKNQDQELITIVATDVDEGENARITYSIGYRLNSDLSTVIEIVASDQGSPVMSSSAELTINFENKCLLQEYFIGESSGIVYTYVLCGIEITPPSLNVVFGSSNTFRCNVLYNSRLSYQWIHNGSFITPSTFIGDKETEFDYSIIDGSFDDAGEYACKASTSVGSLQTVTSTASIQVRPRITVPPKDQAAKKGEEVIFTCTAVGIPDPKIEWYFKDTQKIHEGSTLVISDVNSTKSGTYTCVASNEATDSNAIASAKLTLYTPDNVVELVLHVTQVSSLPTEDGSCHVIDYDAIASTISSLTSGLTTMITEVQGVDLCDISPCLPNPCKEGSCELNERVFGGYECTCSEGYTGINCTLDVKECSESPCENGGSCVEETGSFRCVCANGTSGFRCQYRDSCETTDLCTQDELCVDTISSSGYDCISKPDATSVLVVSVNNIDPGFLDDFLQAYLEKLLASSSTTGRRKRQTTTFSTLCTPRFIQFDTTMDLYALLWLCPSGESPPTDEQQVTFCSVLLELSFVQTCKPPGGDDLVATTAVPLPDTTATVGIILIKSTSSTPLDGLIVEKELENVGAESGINMQVTGIEVTGIKAQQSGPRITTTAPGGNTVNVSGAGNMIAGIIVGVLLGLLIIAALIVATVIAALKYRDHLKRQRRKRDHALERALSTNDFQLSSHRPAHPPLQPTASTAALVNSDDDRSGSNESPSQSNDGDFDDAVYTNQAAV